MRNIEANKVEIEEQLAYIENMAKINEGKNYTYYILTMGCQLNEMTLKSCAEWQRKWDIQK